MTTRLMPGRPVLAWSALRLSPRRFPNVLENREFLLTRSGRSAIVAALMHARLPPGSTVLVPNYYCPSMVAAVRFAGHVPAFYPIAADGRPEVSAALLHSSAARSIIAVHYFGFPAELAALRLACDEAGVLLLEDCAHAFFGDFDGRPPGGLGDYAIASLTKFFPVSAGGALVCRAGLGDSGTWQATGLGASIRAAWSVLEMGAAAHNLGHLGAFVRRVGILRHGRGTLRRHSGDYVESLATEDVAAQAMSDPLLAPAIPTHVDRWVLRACDGHDIAIRRRQNYEQLARELDGVPGCRPLFRRLPDGVVPYVFPVFVDDPARAYRELTVRGVTAFRWNRYWPGAPANESDVGRRWGHHVIQLVCHQSLEHTDLKLIAATLAAASTADRR